MKKKVCALALVLMLALSLLPTAAYAAASSFIDVYDPETARNVEVLRLMGVIQGDEKGLFNPNQNLTRAQFCKMTVVLLGRAAEAGQHRNRTIFPDVRATHWASGYVNLAVTGENAFIHGMPDGTFAPEQSVTFGQAVTILMRVLGYTDKDCGPIWPDGYIHLARANGVSGGLTRSGSEAITRAEAVKLFVNTLAAKRADGTAFSETSEETTLLWVDAAGGRMRTKEESYVMKNPMASTVLDGLRGSVVLDGSGKALTFLPREANPGADAVAANAAVVVQEDGSTAGFSALAGGSVDYRIYKNGTRIDADAVSKYDVATYSQATNTIQLCDTRVAVYYEDCLPSPTAPAVIKALGGTSFNVLPGAREELSAFKPGMVITLLLTADGQVAGAERGISRGVYGDNAVGIVDAEGKVSLICDRTLIPLTLEGVYCDAESMAGRLVSITQYVRNTVYLEQVGSAPIGRLDPVTRTLGYLPIAEQVMIFDQGKLVSLNSIANGAVSADQISCAHLNSSREVDLIVLKVPEPSNVYYGIAIADQVKAEQPEDGQTPPEGEEEQYVWYVKVVCGNGEESPYAISWDAVETGQFVRAELVDGEYVSVRPLRVLRNVSTLNWIGTGAVVAEGETYAVAADAPCYNRDTGVWMNDDRELALHYARFTNLYISEGVVRVVELIG